MTIAIDFDGTIKRSSQFDELEAAMWLAVIHTFVSNGHQVIIATMRTAETDNRDMCPYIDLFNKHMSIDVVCCGGVGLKREACQKAGYTVDVWIDDMPGMIEKPYLINVPNGDPEGME